MRWAAPPHRHIDGLVGQMTVVITGDQFRRSLQCSDRVLDAVMLFKARLETLEDVYGFLNGRLDHIDLLEPA